MLYEHMKMLQQQGVQILSPKIAGWEIPVVAVEKILLECLEILLLEKITTGSTAVTNEQLLSHLFTLFRKDG